MYMAHVYCMSVVVTVWGSVGMFVVRHGAVENSFFSLGVLDGQQKLENHEEN